MLIQTRYEKIRDQIRTGDAIAWRGKGLIPEIIHWATDSPVSHISSVIRLAERDGGVAIPFVAEAMAGGMELNFLSSRIRSQASDAAVWWLPLSEKSRRRFVTAPYARFLLRACEEGIGYDIPQAILSARDLRKRFHTLADPTRLFCSESHCFALLQGRVLKGVNPSEATPQDVVEFRIHANDYYQIYGDKPVELPNFNSVDPDNWDV